MYPRSSDITNCSVCCCYCRCCCCCCGMLSICTHAHTDLFAFHYLHIAFSQFLYVRQQLCEDARAGPFLQCLSAYSYCVVVVMNQRHYLFFKRTSDTITHTLTFRAAIFVTRNHGLLFRMYVCVYVCVCVCMYSHPFPVTASTFDFFLVSISKSAFYLPLAHIYT